MPICRACDKPFTEPAVHKGRPRVRCTRCIAAARPSVAVSNKNDGNRGEEVPGTLSMSDWAKARGYDPRTRSYA